jgi:hypothetical protein
MGNDVDHSTALWVLGWEPLDIIRKKEKVRNNGIQNSK